MKIATFFISKTIVCRNNLCKIVYAKTKQIYTKTLTVPESSFEIKAMLPWILLKILLPSAVICKQRFLHENEIV